MQWSKLLILTYLLFFGWMSHAQNTLSGTVIDAVDKQPLTGANIYLLNNWQVGASSQLDGSFVLKEVTKEMRTDTLVFSFIGYEDLMIALSDWNDQVVKMVLKDSDLSEVTITSTALIAEEFQFERIEKIEVYINPAAKADPLLAVNSLPAATPVDESANISLRGSPASQTGVFFNDVPVYDYVKFSQLNGIGVFSVFNTAMIKNLSVFPGNPPLEYGNVSSGMISITSDDVVAKVNSNSLTVSLASFGYYRTQKLSKKAALSFFVNYQPGGLIKKLNQTSLENIDKFNLFDAGLYLLVKPTNNSLLKVFNYSLAERYRYNFSSPSFNGFFNQGRKRNFTTVKYELKKARSTYSINSGLSISDAEFSFSKAETNLNAKDFYLSFNYQYTGEKTEFKSGISSDNRSQSARGTSPEFSYALAENHPFYNFESNSNTRVNEMFVYGKYYPYSRVTIGAGLRSNLGIGHKFYLARQLNFKFQIADNLSLLAGGGTYFQTLLNRNSTPLFLENQQIAADLKWSSANFVSSLSVFHKKNISIEGIEKISGVELFFEKQITSSLKLDVSATYLDRPESLNLDGSSPIAISYFLRGNISWNMKGSWVIASNLLYREGNSYFSPLRAEFDESLNVYQPFFSEESLHLPNYFSAGISISNEFALSERMTMIVFASINNVSDHQNIRGYSFNNDYSERNASLLSGRVVHFGGLLRF